MDTVRTGIERAALPKRVACSDFAAPAAMSFHPKPVYPPTGGREGTRLRARPLIAGRGRRGPEIRFLVAGSLFPQIDAKNCSDNRDQLCRCRHTATDLWITRFAPA